MSDNSQLRIPSVRLSPDIETILENLGGLKNLAGTWEGEGFNLVARPDFQGNGGVGTNLFLELNLTKETLKFDRISSSIPNRGAFMDDIELFGLTYLQKISDATTGGALHIEPGIWVTIPATTQPNDAASVARMGSIPHGNALLAEGTSKSFSGPPVVSPGANPASGGNPAFSAFPSFNTTPFTITTPQIRAAGTSELASAPGGGFKQYNLANAATDANPRTPLGDSTGLPAVITQNIVNDPIILLQQTIQKQISDGYEFSGTVLNIATSKAIQFFTEANNVTGTPVTVDVTEGGGGTGNIPFLTTNAVTALVYATFWLEYVTHSYQRPFMQLQYAQMVLLNFPAILLPKTFPSFSWPHVSVATLRKTFG